jgi:hypothetical protein
LRAIPADPAPARHELAEAQRFFLAHERSQRAVPGVDDDEVERVAPHIERRHPHDA